MKAIILGFFDFYFDEMIFASIIKLVYAVGIFFLIALALVSIQEQPLIVFPVVVSILIWRVICELIILLFSIHEQLVKIVKNLEE